MLNLRIDLITKCHFLVDKKKTLPKTFPLEIVKTSLFPNLRLFDYIKKSSTMIFFQPDLIYLINLKTSHHINFRTSMKAVIFEVMGKTIHKLLLDGRSNAVQMPVNPYEGGASSARLRLQQGKITLIAATT